MLLDVQNPALLLLHQNISRRFCRQALENISPYPKTEFKKTQTLSCRYCKQKYNYLDKKNFQILPLDINTVSVDKKHARVCFPHVTSCQ